MDKNKKTKETIEYENAIKNMQELYLKMTLSNQGVDTSKVPRQKLDEIKRLYDEKPTLNRKCQEIINKAQQDAQQVITEAQNALQVEMVEIDKQVEDIVKQISADQGLIETGVEK